MLPTARRDVSVDQLPDRHAARGRIGDQPVALVLPGRRAPGTQFNDKIGRRDRIKEYGAMRFVIPRVARRLFSSGTSSILAGSVFVLLLTGAAVASGHYPDRAQNRMEGDRGFIDTKAVQQFLDQHGTWRGSDYFVYCPAFTGAYVQARGPLTITAEYFPSSFTLPLTELEQMNGGRTFTVRYNVAFKYIRTSDKPRIWSSLVKWRWHDSGGYASFNDCQTRDHYERV
jgi:hypothetical protein